MVANKSPPTEVIISGLIWICGVLYAMYHVIGASQVFIRRYYIPEDYSSGWTFLNRHKDSADFEWESSSGVIINLLPWFAAHLAVSECLRSLKNINVILLWQITISISCALYHLSALGSMILIMQPIIFKFICKFRRSAVIWVGGIFMLTVINFLKTPFVTDFLKRLQFTEIQYFMMLMAVCWIHLRCLYYCLNNQANLIDLLAYSLYLPTLFLGPFMLYNDYKNSLMHSAPLLPRLKVLILQVLRFGFWMVFTEYFLHYFYINAISYQPEFVAKMDRWALYGFGYSLGQFFHLKYVVFYGFSTTVGKFDGISGPSTPKCIGRIHLYSDMWKHFDQGLHTFLIRCIYAPFLKRMENKVCATFLCFLFVYVWHGLQTYILMWTVLNFVGIVIEVLFKNLYEFKFVRSFWDDLDELWRRRILCVVTSPLLVMSALSNFYFFAGVQVGNCFLWRFFNDTFLSKLVVLFFLYCCCQISTEIKNWEKSPSKLTKNR